MKLKFAYCVMAVACLGLSLAHAESRSGQFDQYDDESQSANPPSAKPPANSNVVNYVSLTGQVERHDKNEKSFGVLEANSSDTTSYGGNGALIIGTDEFGDRSFDRGQLIVKSGSGSTRSTEIRGIGVGVGNNGLPYGGAGAAVFGNVTRLAHIPVSLNGYACTGTGSMKFKAGVAVCGGLGMSWERHELGGVQRKHFGSYEALVDVTTKYLDAFAKASATMSFDDPRVMAEAGLAAKISTNFALTASGSIEHVEIESGEDLTARKQSATDLGVNTGVRVSF